MSEIVELIRPRTHHSNATYRVRCDHCGRLYVTSNGKTRIRSQRFCIGCRPPLRPKDIKTISVPVCVACTAEGRQYLYPAVVDGRCALHASRARKSA